jgi:hypothetical protein
MYNNKFSELTESFWFDTFEVVGDLGILCEIKFARFQLWKLVYNN